MFPSKPLLLFHFFSIFTFFSSRPFFPPYGISSALASFVKTYIKAHLDRDRYRFAQVLGAQFAYQEV